MYMGRRVLEALVTPLVCRCTQGWRASLCTGLPTLDPCPR